MAEQVSIPAWQIVAIGGRPAAVAHADGRWSVVLRRCCGNGATFDEALGRALREGNRS